MASVNLESMSVKELERHIVRAQKVLDKKKSANTTAFIKEARVLARKMGVDIDGVLASPAPARRKKKSRKLEPKYRNPDDASVTWSGVGRAPKWAVKAKAQGKLETLKI